MLTLGLGREMVPDFKTRRSADVVSIDRALGHGIEGASRPPCQDRQFVRHFQTAVEASSLATTLNLEIGK